MIYYILCIVEISCRYAVKTYGSCEEYWTVDMEWQYRRYFVDG